MPDVPEFVKWPAIYYPPGRGPWPPGDPGPEIWHALEEADRIRVTQLLGAYKLKVAEAQAEFYKQIMQLPTMAKSRG